MGLFDKVAAAAVGPIIGGVFSAVGQSRANEATQASTQQQMDFQREMRGTQYQAAMDDMRKAGLNPMLAYQQGGAGVLSGSSYTAQNELAPLGAALEAGTSSAMAMRRQNADLEAIEVGNRAMEAGIHKTRQDLKTSAASERLNIRMAAKASADTNLTDQLGARSRLDYKFKQMELNSARAAQVQAIEDEKFNRSTTGKVLRWIDRAGQAINPFSSAVSKQRK